MESEIPCISCNFSHMDELLLSLIRKYLQSAKFQSTVSVSLEKHILNFQLSILITLSEKGTDGISVFSLLPSNSPFQLLHFSKLGIALVVIFNHVLGLVGGICCTATEDEDRSTRTGEAKNIRALMQKRKVSLLHVFASVFSSWYHLLGFSKYLLEFKCFPEMQKQVFTSAIKFIISTVSYVIQSKEVFFVCFFFNVVLVIRAGQKTILLIFSQLYNFLFTASSVFC